jgi:hypothetical protein
VDGNCVVLAVREGHFEAVFGRSRHSQPHEVAHVSPFTVVWRRRSFLPPSLSPHLDFCDNPCQIQEQPFNLLVHQIWSIFFLLCFFYLEWFIKLVYLFNFTPIIFFNHSNLILILLILIFLVLSHFLNWFYFAISPSLAFFPIKFNSCSFDCYFFGLDKFLSGIIF